MAGTHTAIDGATHEFSEADIAELISSYDAANYPAPIVVGHPKTDDPAYGWVSGLQAENAIVIARPEKVEAQFAEMVRDGRFKKVSASIYDRADPANPMPGKLYLKHVGFLGAKAPAIKGLKPVQFAEDASAPLTFETPLKEKIMAVEGQKTAMDFAEREASLAAREAEIKQREEENEAAAQALADQQSSLRRTEAASFAEAQVAAGKLAPAGRALVAGIMLSLSESPRPMSFGEADGEMEPTAALRKLFAGAGTIVNFGEAAKADPNNPTGEDDRTPEEIAAQAREYAEDQRSKGNSITMTAAVRHVRNQGKGK